MLSIAQLAQQITDPQIKTLLDNLIKSSPLLATAAVIPASHTDVHKYKHWTSLPTIKGRNFQGEFETSQPVKEIKQIDLKQLGVVEEEDQRVVESSSFMTPMGFYDEHAPTYFEAMGQAIANAIYTGSGDGVTFNSFDYYAALNSTEVDATGSSSGSRTAIYCVKWDPNKTAIVVNPSVVQDISTLVRVTPLNIQNGTMGVRMKDSATGKTPIYEVLYDSVFNLLNNSNANISVYKNVEDTSDKRPTATGMLELIDHAKATPGDSIIVTSRLGRRLISRLKNDKLQMMTTDNNYQVSTLAFDGIPIYLDENISEEL